nr:hypothetical protein [Terriglobales bacterium]
MARPLYNLSESPFLNKLVRISRRTSGGRGEYELSEASRAGLQPTDFLNIRIILSLDPDLRFDTGTIVTAQGGKRRLRLLPGTEIHLHRQLAAAVLLPRPIRSDETLGRGAPVARTDQYAIETIEFRTVEMLLDGSALFAIEEIDLRNRSYGAEELGFSKRLASMKSLWSRSEEFPKEVASLIQEHLQVVRSGGPLPRRCEVITHELQALVSETGLDFGILYYDGTTDVLPLLVSALRDAPAPPEPPLQLEAVAPEDIEIRKRTVKEWKRWANSRG